MAGRRAVLIAGPTASGKTQAAIAMARRTGARIVNADSMQVYRGLSLLTARPEPADLAAAPHFLFGHVDPAVRYSTGAWLTDVREVIQDAETENQELIFVGGTGLYFDSLVKGFAEIPPVAAELIQAVEQEVAALDAAGRRALLAAHDPETAQALAVADPQRVVRAVTVQRATGVPLSAHQKRGGTPLLDGYALDRIVLMPERGVLRERIARRFETMMARGARHEVAALQALDLDPTLPVMKAIGVPEIARAIAGEIDEAEAIALAVTATRQYAKRQSTWFRNRMGDWRFVEAL